MTSWVECQKLSRLYLIPSWRVPPSSARPIVLSADRRGRSDPYVVQYPRHVEGVGEGAISAPVRLRHLYLWEQARYLSWSLRFEDKVIFYYSHLSALYVIKPAFECIERVLSIDDEVGPARLFDRIVLQ